MITLNQLYEATNRGLDIIKAFYPQAREDGRKFKCREEDDASACLKLYQNVWKLTDFGDDGHALSPIDVAMKETRLSLPKAIAQLARRFGVEDTSIRAENKPHIERRPARPEEEEGAFRWKAKEFSDYELKILGPKVTREICQEYGYVSLAWYARTRKDEKGSLSTTVVNSTDSFPIFLRDCGAFQKIYTPLSYKKEYRFSYAGAKPKNFVNGLAELRKCVEDYNGQEKGEEEEKRPSRGGKYPSAVICCGERDALCCAAFGYKPLWFNSETYHLPEEEYATMAGLVETLYYIPDLDATGIRKAVELALRFPDIHLVWLPAWLKDFRDWRGKPRKDLRDYAELQPDNASFKKLVGLGMPLRFWQQQADPKGGFRYEVNTAYLIHFLRCMGFGIYKGERGEEFVRVVENKVQRVSPGDVRRFVSGYVKDQPAAIRNVVSNSARVSASTFELIGDVELDFTRCTPDSQSFFFRNGICTVTKDEIRTTRYAGSPFQVWEEQIKPHDFKRTSPAFSIAREEGAWRIGVHHQDSNFFKYLIQTSRMYWREELEVRARNLPGEERSRYAERNRFRIDGELLTEAERREQELHLVNKIFTLGYLLHRYKFANRAWIAYGMDARISDNGEANGRSGKSFFMKALGNLIHTVTLSGRNEHLTDNPHVLDRVTSHVDLVLVDDAFQYLDLGFFFDNTTGDMVVNPKRLQSYSIPFEESPKLAITTNYAPTKTDGSTQARLLYMAFSDYYHQMSESSDYLESRDIYSDFGMRLMDRQYPEEEWNRDFNFMFDCLQFYLSTIEDNIKIDPPMENIRIRTNKIIMGESFEDWAIAYFSEKGGNVNALRVREEVFADFCQTNRNNKWTAKKFIKALRAFCDNNGYVLNPPQLCTDGRRIIRRVGDRAKECFYIQTPGMPVLAVDAIEPDETASANPLLF